MRQREPDGTTIVAGCAMVCGAMLRWAGIAVIKDVVPRVKVTDGERAEHRQGAATVKILERGAGLERWPRFFAGERAETVTRTRAETALTEPWMTAH